MKLVNIADIAGEVYEIGGGSLEVKHIVKENDLNARVINISPGMKVSHYLNLCGLSELFP